jgi:hypothetical protein
MSAYHHDDKETKLALAAWELEVGLSFIAGISGVKHWA